VFAEFPDAESSRTALREMCGMPPDHTHVVTIKGDYASIGAIHQRKVEDAIAALAESGRAGASDVFSALADALGSDHDSNPSSQIYDLIVQYVVQVARVWRQVGLRPSRARHRDDASYKSKFHRFVDLVLTPMIEPEARRHLVDLDDMRRTVRRIRAALPDEVRRVVSPAPGRADTVWLVSDDHLKKALRIAAQKIDPDTP
jgi:hypothetical protein